MWGSKLGLFVCGILLSALWVGEGFAWALDSKANPAPVSPCPSLTRPPETDPILEWLRIEQTLSVQTALRPTAPQLVQVARVPLSRVEILKGPGLTAEILNLFVQGDEVLWPLHPFNHDSTVPHHSALKSPWNECHFTASRSMALRRQGLPLLSVKMPTNCLSPGSFFPEKADNRDSVTIGIARSRYIAWVDAQRGAPEGFRVLLDLLALRDPETLNGVVIRDLSPLQDGRTRIPLFALAYSPGKILAAAEGLSHFEFLRQKVFEPLGRMKARFLLRYGLDFESPNAQNFLFIRNAEGRIADEIEVRDVGDTRFDRRFLNAKNLHSILQQERMQENETVSAALPNTGNALDFMSWESGLGEPGIPTDWKRELREAGDAAFYAELALRLGFGSNSVATPDWVNGFLFQEAGMRALGLEGRPFTSPLPATFYGP